MAGRVEGKVAFITGAARGQGRSHAVRLAGEGADIIGIDICEDVDSIQYPMGTMADLEETKRQVEALGRKMLIFKADVRDFDALKAAADAGFAEFGRLDIVVANAGIASFAMTDQMEESMLQDVIDINLTGVWHTYKATVNHMIAAGNGGSIMFISSTGGLKGLAAIPHYVSAKHGLVGLARTCAIEVAPHMIRVNTIHPTNIDTDMINNQSTRQAFRPDLDREVTKEDMVESATAMNLIPVPWIDSIEISHAVLFLGSDEARFITAAKIPVDAGMSQK